MAKVGTRYGGGGKAPHKSAPPSAAKVGAANYSPPTPQTKRAPLGTRKGK